MADHAEIRLGEYTVPLIGVPKTAVMETCDLCQLTFHMQDVQFIDTSILCPKCLLAITFGIYHLAGNQLNG